MTKSKTVPGDALAVLSTVALASFIVATLYFARSILIPLALAALLTFLLAPLVTRLERWLGRVAAVLLVVAMIFAATAMAGWVLTRQVLDLAAKLPDYKENIITKLHAFRVPKRGTMATFSKTIDELKSELPGAPGAVATAPPTPTADTRQPTVYWPAAPVTAVKAETSGEKPMDLLESLIAPLLGPLGTSALVLLLVVFMLLQREDLRNRVIRLIGQGRISITTRAMDDASQRVSRYLLMQLVVNVSYGITVAIGLYFIGVPNALLWGGVATVLRFIPYVGPWIGAAFPITLALAVSAGWLMPLLTIGLFVVLELLCSNVVEPWLYGANTGVSSIALVVAAVVWTWLWGPVGLILSTPLTVCLVVMGRHVPRLSFLSVVLSDEEALTPAETYYHRLLTVGEHDELEFVEAFLKEHPLADLYDAVFIPLITAAEIDARHQALDQPQLLILEQGLRDIIQDLALRPPVVSPTTAAETISAIENITASETNADAGKISTAETSTDAEAVPPLALPPCRVCCLPARADRDELAGSMLAHLLQQQGCEAWATQEARGVDALLGLLEKAPADVVCISVVAPTTVIHARYLCLKVHARCPHLKIVVGLWGATEGVLAATQRLRDSGADAVVVSLADAVAQVASLNAPPPSPSVQS